MRFWGKNQRKGNHGSNKWEYCYFTWSSISFLRKSTNWIKSGERNWKMKDHCKEIEKLKWVNFIFAHNGCIFSILSFHSWLTDLRIELQKVKRLKILFANCNEHSFLRRLLLPLLPRHRISLQSQSCFAGWNLMK